MIFSKSLIWRTNKHFLAGWSEMEANYDMSSNSRLPRRSGVRCISPAIFLPTCLQRSAAKASMPFSKDTWMPTPL